MPILFVILAYIFSIVNTFTETKSFSKGRKLTEQVFPQYGFILTVFGVFNMLSNFTFFLNAIQSIATYSPDPSPTMTA